MGVTSSVKEQNQADSAETRKFRGGAGKVAEEEQQNNSE